MHRIGLRETNRERPLFFGVIEYLCFEPFEMAMLLLPLRHREGYGIFSLMISIDPLFCIRRFREDIL